MTSTDPEQTVKPYNRAGKKEEVEHMFDSIAPRYDFLNHFFSLGIDRIWRRKALRLALRDHPSSLLDVATGTADFAMEAARMSPDLKCISGVDISEGMLARGREKVRLRGWSDRIVLSRGDSEQLPFPDDSFDAVTVAFGVRNFEDLRKGLAEMRRVLKPGKPLVVLEFSTPENFPVRQLFGLYFRRIMPVIGKVVSKDPRAYSYLPESVATFPSGEAFARIMEECGFCGVRSKPLSGGIASIYSGYK